MGTPIVHHPISGAPVDRVVTMQQTLDTDDMLLVERLSDGVIIRKSPNVGSCQRDSESDTALHGCRSAAD